MFKFSHLMLVSVLALALAACNTSVDLKCESSSQTTDKNKATLPEIKSESVEIEILVDATPSMRGYVNNNRQSRYEQTLDWLDSSAVSGWTNNKSLIKYYLFGTSRRQIDRQGYLNAKKPAIYSGDIFLDSQLKAALAPPSPNKLSVIVTDLYQTDNDVPSVLESLKNEYLKKGYAIGILGVRSEFNGVVYDIGIRGDQRSYNTTNKKEDKFHPFYVVLLGSYENVEYYFNELSKQSGGVINQDQFIVFYSKSFRTVSSFDLDKYPSDFSTSKANIKRGSGTFVGDSVRATVKDVKSVLPILVSSSSGTSAKGDASNYTVQHKISYAPLPFTLEVDVEKGNGFKVEPKSLVFDKDKNGFLKSVESKFIQFDSWQIAKSADSISLSFKTQIKSDAMAKGEIYKLNAGLIPSSFKEPDWWQAWNLDERGFDRSNQNNFDGSKTLNLQSFLRGLKSITTELIDSNKPIAANLCFAVQKE